MLVVTLLMVYFTDAFGPFQNSYHSLTATYRNPSNLPLKEQRALDNNRTVTITPHGLQLATIPDAMSHAGRQLD